MAPELWPDDELTRLANRYCSDKGTTYNCAHGYTRVYQALLAPLREAALRMLEIGLVHGQVQAERPQDIDQLACPSLRMWSDYLPRAEIRQYPLDAWFAVCECARRQGLSEPLQSFKLHWRAAAADAEHKQAVKHGILNRRGLSSPRHMRARVITRSTLKTSMFVGNPKISQTKTNAP